MVEEEAGEEREQKRGLLGGRCGDCAGSMPEIEHVYPVRTACLYRIVSQARPNQPQRGSLSVSRTGKEGSGDFR